MFTLANLLFNVSIRAKILGLILVIYAAIFCVSIYFFNDFVNRIETDLGEKLVKQQVSVTKERTLNYFANALGLIKAGLVNYDFQAWMTNPQNKEFETTAFRSISATCVITNCQGWFIYTHNSLEGFDWQIGNETPTPSSIVLERDKWYTHIMNTGKDFYTDASIHPITQKPYIYFDYFVREQGTLLGLVGTYVNIAPAIQDILQHPSEQVSNLLVDNNGIVRGFYEDGVNNKHAELVAGIQGLKWSDLVDEKVNSASRLLREDESKANLIYVTQISLQGRRYLAAVMFVEELEWYSVSLLDIDILSGKIDTLPLIIISLLVFVIVLWLTIYVLNTQLFNPILAIHGVIKNISRGRHAEQIQLQNKDELGALAAGINKMTKELSGNLSKIQEQNAALNDAINTANNANKAKSLFLSNMSHELRTPLNAVLGFTQVGIDAIGEKVKDDYLKKVNQAGEHLLLIINDILDFNKIESNELTLEHGPFMLGEAVRSVLHICHLRAQNKGLTLKVSIDDNIPRNVVGDSLRVKQILINLLSNAIKFTEQGCVEIASTLKQQTDKHVVIETRVTDSGIGMSAEQLARLFKPFTQADESITRKYGGTGLGLAITKQLVELMQGQIEVISEEGEGSSFIFTITLGCDLVSTTPSPVEQKSLNVETLQKATSGSKLLLVEDNPINQVVAEKLLEPLQFVIDLAEDGAIAVDKVKNNDYDIILMDVHMPNLDGIEATKQIRTFNNITPIIGLSADVNKEDVDRAKQSGMNHYLTKPIKREELFSCIYTFLTQSVIKR